MTADEILLDVEERMEKAIAVSKSALAGIRTGRANPGLVDSLRVEVYGSPVPIKQLASVGAPEPNADRHPPLRSRHAQGHRKGDSGQRPGLQPAERRPRDPPERAAAVDRSPPQDGRPHQGPDRRGQGGAFATSAATATRWPTRREKDKDLSEDDRDQVKEEIQELTKNYESQANDLAKAREKDVMED